MARTNKPWMAIVNLDQPSNPARPIVIADIDGITDSPTCFGSVAELRAFFKDSTLRMFECYAFNFVTGEVEEI